MEFKADEAYLFAHAQAGALPGLGQASGVGLRNPGLSVWIFVTLDHGFGLHTPTALARAVMLVNVAALALLVVFATRCVARPERERWLWATALTAVNPALIVFSRKIWAQSVLPFFTMVALICWWRRGRARMSFGWGVSGALLGQIHMSGFFFAGGLALWTALFDRRSARWRAWLAGSAVGAVPLIPWVHTSSRNTRRPAARCAISSSLRSGGCGSSGRWASISTPRSAAHAASFLAEPRSAVIRPTASRCLCRSRRQRAPDLRGWRQGVVAARGDWRAMLAGHTPTALAVGGALAGFGVLLTATAATVYRHYLIVASPCPSPGWRAWPCCGRAGAPGARGAVRVPGRDLDGVPRPHPRARRGARRRLRRRLRPSNRAARAARQIASACCMRLRSMSMSAGAIVRGRLVRCSASADGHQRRAAERARLVPLDVTLQDHERFDRAAGHALDDLRLTAGVVGPLVADAAPRALGDDHQATGAEHDAVVARASDDVPAGHTIW